MIELLGIPVSATRRKCALLNLKVVRGAVTGDNAGRRDRGAAYAVAAAAHRDGRSPRAAGEARHPRYNS